MKNIAEGSEAAATSSKTELKLTQVARASLEELKLDYEDFLRQRGLPCWDRHHPLRQELVDARPKTADDVAAWVVEKARQRYEEERKSGPSERSGHDEDTVSTVSTPSSVSTFYPELSANAILTLATVAGFLLDRQMALLAKKFEHEDGFTERLNRVRSARRQQP